MSQIRLFLTNKLSQWAQFDMVIDSVRYNCCEQWMMAEKARLFDDKVSLEKIMAVQFNPSHNDRWTKVPGEQKRLGRLVAGFDKDKWETVAQEVIYKGNYAKFDQNPECWDFLNATGDDILAEANPKDPLWGIGLGRDDPRAMDQAQWQGKNWLGFALMRVREQIRKDRAK